MEAVRAINRADGLTVTSTDLLREAGAVIVSQQYPVTTRPDVADKLT
ncbi:hypothetical protein MSM1_00815 [Mycobacterium sp. SM1]|nr:hypothetical protein [Mycobacterium sp. SM1]MBS4726969.1 hypothetical protein [Mycobacterium sp. SM1]